MPAQSVATELSHLPPRRLWLGTVGGAAAWTVQFFACVIITRLACSGRYANWAAPSETQALIILACVSAILFVLTIAAGVISFRNWQAVTRERDFFKAEATSPEQYLSLIGVFVNAAFTLAIIWNGLGLLLVGVCVWER